MGTPEDEVTQYLVTAGLSPEVPESIGGFVTASELRETIDLALQNETDPDQIRVWKLLPIRAEVVLTGLAEEVGPLLAERKEARPDD